MGPAWTEHSTLEVHSNRTSRPRLPLSLRDQRHTQTGTVNRHIEQTMDLKTAQEKEIDEEILPARQDTGQYTSTERWVGRQRH